MKKAVGAEGRVFALLKEGLASARGFSKNQLHSVWLQCGTDLFECDDVGRPRFAKRADFIFMLRGNAVRYVSHKASGFSWHGYGSLWRKCWTERKRAVVPVNAKAMVWTRNFCVRHCYDGQDRPGLLEWAGRFYEGIWFVPGRDLQLFIVYGPDYGRERGPNNVDFLAIGDPEFTQQGKGKWLLAFPDGIYRNGEVPVGDNTPIIVVKRKSDMTTRKHIFYTEPFPVKGLKADFGYFPIRLMGPPVLSKGLGCVQVAYPSGSVV